MKLKRIWYKKTNFFDSLKPQFYVQATNYNRFMKNEAFYTLVNNLECINDDMLVFSKSCRSEIRRAMKDNLIINERDGLSDDFIIKYNQFAELKGLSSISLTALNNLSSHYYEFNILQDKKLLVSHLCHLDEKTSTARLLFSYTNIELSSDFRSVIGRANRYLHFSSMQKLKSMGFTQYDFGGISTGDIVHFNGIDNFKNSFNGEIKLYYNSVPFFIFLLSKLRG
ncbi:hypothetical protein [Aliivibrio fischeri]|uniref:hypothetical protein n=1 Tax=Aliivibrio fischeri TaxID=668 RepID=UPI0012D89817|nr:hypothetical protein [Aliivibrio fischeri]MUK26521.1 hypothetical protein [Aliivibrio fischeri]MUK33717.1 hypothetical protein [Aliivibrio fischeri]